jgi:hypothetical protein
MTETRLVQLLVKMEDAVDDTQFTDNTWEKGQKEKQDLLGRLRIIIQQAYCDEYNSALLRVRESGDMIADRLWQIIRQCTDEYRDECAALSNWDNALHEWFSL